MARRISLAVHGRHQLIAVDGVLTQEVDSRPVPIELNPRQLSLMRMPPEELSLSDLYRAIGSARRQGDRATHLELAWWQRATVPVVTLVMSFLAVAIVLFSPRATTLGGASSSGRSSASASRCSTRRSPASGSFGPGADPQRASPHRDRASLRGGATGLAEQRVGGQAPRHEETRRRGP
jgi:hypothetical protein